MALLDIRGKTGGTFLIKSTDGAQTVTCDPNAIYQVVNKGGGTGPLYMSTDGTSPGTANKTAADFFEVMPFGTARATPDIFTGVTTMTFETAEVGNQLIQINKVGTNPPIVMAT